MKTFILLLGAAALVLSAALPAKADPAQAEDVAFRMAMQYRARGFNMAPTDHSGVMGTGQSVRFIIPVTKGVDYVFLVGTDPFAKDTDVYVYDEVGSLILDDRRPDPLAGVKFRSSYNGTATVYVVMERADGLASWFVLVGRRGVGVGETASRGEADLTTGP